MIDNHPNLPFITNLGPTVLYLIPAVFATTRSIPRTFAPAVAVSTAVPGGDLIATKATDLPHLEAVYSSSANHT